MRVLLIIPAYNEEENILNTVESIKNFQISQVGNVNVELDYIVINDGSTDGTTEIIKKNSIQSINLVINLGIGGAVQTGYKYALINNYDIAVQFDGDGQHDINSIVEVISPIIEGNFDFCVGSRFVEGAFSKFQTTKMRRAGIRLISKLIRLVSGKKIADVTSGYRAANKKIIALFAANYPTEYPEPESLVKLFKKNYSVKEVPVNMLERMGGVSSISSLNSIRYMVEVGTAILVAAFMKEHD